VERPNALHEHVDQLGVGAVRRGRRAWQEQDAQPWGERAGRREARPVESVVRGRQSQQRRVAGARGQQHRPVGVWTDAQRSGVPVDGHPVEAELAPGRRQGEGTGSGRHVCSLGGERCGRRLHRQRRRWAVTALTARPQRHQQERPDPQWRRAMAGVGDRVASHVAPRCKRLAASHPRLDRHGAQRIARGSTSSATARRRLRLTAGVPPPGRVDFIVRFATLPLPPPNRAPRVPAAAPRSLPGHALDAQALLPCSSSSSSRGVRSRAD
jgi:hypothetical protein